MTMKPEFMRLRRALAGAVAALLLAAGLVVFSPALSASAHHNTITASASCVNYQWTITWSITNSEQDKTETVTSSSDPTIISQGTQIAMGATYTKTEIVSGPVDKTLTISAQWSNGYKQTNAKTIRTTDFAGTCTPPSSPVIALLVAPCVAGGALGAVTAKMSDLTSGTTYRLSLHSSGGAVLETIEHTANSASFEVSFAQRGPGTYYATVAIGTGAVLASSANATISECPSDVTVSVQLEPCTLTVPERGISVQVDGLAPSTVYTIQLVDAASTVVASVTTPGDNLSSFAHTFTGFPTPGDYSITVLGAPEPVVSESVAVPLCDLETMAPPSIELTADSCDSASPTPAALTARMEDLDPTKTYYVRIVSASGATVAGGGDKMVTGSTTAVVAFPDITVPGDYTAQLLIDPGKQLAATSLASASLGMCLPTLAMTGPGALVPLGAVAALLLTLGGAVVTGRLRRQVAL